MSRFRALGVVVALVAALLMASPGASHAATGSVKDPKGDAPKAIDITSLKVVNSKKAIKGTIKVRNLGNKGLFTTAWVRPDGTLPNYGVNIQKKKGKTKATLVKIAGGGAKKVKCAGLKATWKAPKNTVTFKVPQKCNGKKIPASWVFSTTSVQGTKVDVLDSTLTVKRG